MTHSSSAHVALVALVLTGCHLDLADVATSQSYDGGMGMQASEAGDGAVQDGKVEPSPPVKHAGCAMALPEALPPEPLVAVDARGRPVFDYFRELPCDDPSVAGYPTCDDYAGQPTIECFGCADSTRLCQSSSPEVPEAFCAPLTVGEPACVTCVPLAAKRKACCDGLDTACDPWPFNGKVKVGGACAVHADCEPGLVCLEYPDGLIYSELFGYGLCACPESPYPATECSERRVP